MKRDRFRFKYEQFTDQHSSTKGTRRRRRFDDYGPFSFLITLRFGGRCIEGPANYDPRKTPWFSIPGFDGAVFSQEWMDALWAKFSMGAPRRQTRSVERYRIVKRARGPRRGATGLTRRQSPSGSSAVQLLTCRPARKTEVDGSACRGRGDHRRFPAPPVAVAG